MVQLAEISWIDAEKYFSESDVVIIPVGSTEQHGPHNPLGTDYLNAEAVSREIGRRTNILVLPTIPVGISPEHRQFPGTLWVPPLVFREYVKAIAISATSHGVRKIVFVNGHGGNQFSLYEVTGDLRREHGVFAVIVGSMPPETQKIFGEQGGGHAGAGETSAMLYWHSDLVKMERAPKIKEKEMLGSLKMVESGQVRFGLFVPQSSPAIFRWDTIDISETGVIGAPGKDVDVSISSAEKYKPIIEAYISNLCKFVETLKEEDVLRLLSKPHK